MSDLKVYVTKSGNRYYECSEVEALPKRIKELEDQLQQKDEDIVKYKERYEDFFDLQTKYREALDLNPGQFLTSKLLRGMKSQLTSYKELMGRMAGAIEGAIELRDLWLIKECKPEHENEAIALQNMKNQFDQLLTEYKNLEP